MLEDEFLDELPRRVAAAPAPLVDPALLGPLCIVSVLLLLAQVLTVDDEIVMPPSASLPNLEAWLDEPGGGGVFRFSRPQGDFQLLPVATPSQLFQATLFQWRVYALETSYPTGFSRDDDPVIELVRALFQYFSKGLKNQAKYESNCAAEFRAGADAALATLGTPTGEPGFVKGFGLSIAANGLGDDEPLGVTSLRVRQLPSDVWDFANTERDYVGYITGLAVAKSARRRGVASGMLDFCARKSQAWGARGIALHVNKRNKPALRFYASLGFDVVPDWFGFNNQRFLLYADFKP